MNFCENCKMNVFSARPEFNTMIFVVNAVVMFIIVFILMFSPLFYFFYFMWFFMVVNPYLIYYGLQPKKFCPKCRSRVVEKNLGYEPFGSKKGEGLPRLPYETQTTQVTQTGPVKQGWFCPYCGAAISRDWKFCKACGKTLEINL
jgi:hypothetical protein